MTRKLWYACLVCLVTLSGPAAGQLPLTPEFPEEPVSMGQPNRIRYTWGPMGGHDFDREVFTGRVFLDVTTRGLYPQFGIGSFTAELALGAVENDFDYAIGAYFKVPWIRVGGEYNFFDQKFIPAFTAELAITRGGLFNRGEEFRIDVRPWDKQLYVGLTFNNPFVKYRKTRPTKDYVSIPKAPKPKEPKNPAFGLDAATIESLNRAMANVEHGLRWMDRLLTPHFKTGYRTHLSENN